MGIKIKNNAVSTIPLALSSAATSLTVASEQGSRFPVLGAGDYFYATISDTGNNFEIVKVTARFDDVMTVTRGQEGTLAVPFAANARIELRVTAQSILDHLPFNVVNFTGTGAQVAYTMPATVAKNSTMVFINGVYQQKNTYSVSGTTLTFSQAPPITSTIEVMYGVV
jgi:hypothetical protein